MAKWIPLSSRPGIGKSRGLVAPQQSTIASNSFAQFARPERSMPISVLVTNLTPSAAIRSTRRCTILLVELHVGNAVHEQAADAVGAFINGHQVTGAIELRRAGKSRRAGPTTATFLPVRFSGGSGMTHPSAKPLSMIAHSMFLIVTGDSLIPSTHEPSQGAGQTRPVNSGKLLVLCNRSSASCHRPR